MATFDAKDFISAGAIVISTCIAVIGWAKAAQKDRKQHMFQKRVEKRLAMFDGVLEAVKPLFSSSNPFEVDSELPYKLAQARLSLQLYGFRDEQMLYEDLIQALKSADVERTHRALTVFSTTIRERLRTEMGFKPGE